MASVNKVFILGNLGQDPEVRYAPSGTAVCSISVATTRSWKNRDSGERQEETEWHRIVFYDRMAEIAGEYLKKGKPVHVEGRLKTRKWQDKDGNDKYTTEIIAESMQLIGGRDDDGGGQRQQSRQQQGNSQRGQQQRQQAPQQQRQQQRTGNGFDDMDDDIPF
jgi:single-strand DNA-binding protein